MLSPVVCDKVTGISKGTHRVGDVLCLVLRHHEFAGDRSYHIHMQNILNMRSAVNPKHYSFEPKALRVSDYEIRFLPRMNAWASSEVFCDSPALQAGGHWFETSIAHQEAETKKASKVSS